MPNLTLLVIEEDHQIACLLATSLELLGYRVGLAHSAQQGLTKSVDDQPDLVMLDGNLQSGEAFKLCQQLHLRTPDLPLLMLSSLATEQFAAKAIESGANDYIYKPIALQELNVRIRRLLAVRSQPMLYGAIKMDLEKQQVRVDDQLINLGKREFAILWALVKRAGHLITKQEVIDAIDANPEVYDRPIESHVDNLRSKLRRAGATELLVPVFDFGYRLEPA